MRQALMIVDIQNDYFPGGKMELVGMEAASRNAQRVLEFFRFTGFSQNVLFLCLTQVFQVLCPRIRTKFYVSVNPDKYPFGFGR